MLHQAHRTAGSRHAGSAPSGPTERTARSRVPSRSAAFAHRTQGPVADSLAGTLARAVAERAAPRGTLPFKGRLEQSFGESLGDVSVQTGAQAELAPLGALAATRGNSIVFAETAPPLDTVAHEIAHVIQNRHATSPPRAAVEPQGGPAELEASAAARSVVAGGTASVSAAPGGEVQCFLGIGGKKKKPARPAQPLPAPARPKQDLPAPARPKQALPPVAGAVPQAAVPFQERQFDLGSDDMDLFQARQFDMGPAAPASEPRQVDMAPQPPAHVAPSADDGFAPELVPDDTGLVPVTGNPYLEQLVARFASNKTAMTHRSYGELRNLQVIASLTGAPPPRPIDPRYKAAVSTAYDWGFAY